MKKIVGFVCLVLVCVGIKSCMAHVFTSDIDDSERSSKAAKSRKSGLKIYDVDVTSEKVKHDGDSDDCFITISGNTDAPNGSIVYAQRGNGEANLAYGDTDNKVKNHHFNFLLLASNLFDLDSIKVGQKANLKIYCTNQKFEYSLDDSELISRKVRRKVADSDIEPYTITATKKMVHVAEYD